MDSPLGTVDKAIDILFHLHREGASRGVTEIGRSLGIPKSSAHRLLAALRQRGLIEQDDRGRYLPGIGLIALGVGVLEREPTVAAARPVLEREAESLGETFFLVGARAGQLVVLDKVEGTGFLRAAPRIGAVVPVHATAVGKLQLAFGPEEVEFASDGELEAFTDVTLGGTALDRSVEQAREQGPRRQGAKCAQGREARCRHHAIAEHQHQRRDHNRATHATDGGARRRLGPGSALTFPSVSHHEVDAVVDGDTKGHASHQTRGQ